MDRGLSDLIAKMKVMTQGAATVGDLPAHLAEQVAALTEATQALERAEQQQEVLKGQLQVATETLNAEKKRANGLYQRLTLALKVHYSPKAQTLEVFGIKVK